MRIKIKRLPHCFALPEYKSLGAAGADLYSSEKTTIPPGALWLFPLGICLEIPVGYFGLILPRSGLSKKCIHVAPGTIDSDYRGELAVVASNEGNGNWEVSVGDRIAQLVISPVAQAVFVESEELSETERGGKGFGSSGV
jgi:dUTP pyrophosphatase